MKNSMNNIHDTFDEPSGPTLSLTAGTMLGGKYELIRQIGRGGMGVVWKAKDMVADRFVALKFVANDLNRFEAEMNRMRESFKKIHELQHQSICALYGLEDGGSLGYYVVMRYLEGETLNEYVSRTEYIRPGLPLDRVVAILRQVAMALDYAHENKVIHRDVKPSNIFLVKTAKGLDVQMIDFDLAREIQSSLSQVNQVQIDTSGTRPYMAPEQWRGRRQTAATDQYALAVVAYELLAGHLPFEGADSEMLRMAVLNGKPEPIIGQPEHVNTALLKALAKDGSGRFESCKKFVEALIVPNDLSQRQAQKNKPIEPPPVIGKRHDATKNEKKLGRLLYKTEGIFATIYLVFGVLPKRFYENGVEIVAPEGMKTIFYSDITAMSYFCSISKIPYLTVIGVDLWFKSYDGTEYLTRVINDKEKIEPVFEKINRCIISKMVREIEENGATPWACDVSFTKSALLKKTPNETIRIPYNRITSVTVASPKESLAGLKTMTIKSSVGVVIQVDTRYNLLPGLFTLKTFCENNGVLIDWQPLVYKAIHYEQ